MTAELAFRTKLEAVILEHFHAPDDLHPTWWIRPSAMADDILGLFAKAGE